MRLTTALSSFIAFASTSAFTLIHSSCRTSQLRATADLPSAPKVLTAHDVMAKSAASNVNAGEEIPKLFTEEIYRDFQSALLKLEKRVSEGRGALTSGEVHEFEFETGRIVEEMK